MVTSMCCTPMVIHLIEDPSLITRVQWLENQGELPFMQHHLCYMPGVLNAKAGDFDGDGDLDVVAASLLAGPIREQLKERQHFLGGCFHSGESGGFPSYSA